MRVIGGTFGGRRLRAVEGYATRPTSDRVREALFSRIEARYGLAGATVLDVFAGTGALAIEALSRGAWRAVCIEVEKRALETLRTNVRELDLETKVRVIGDDYRRVLARLGQRGEAGCEDEGEGASAGRDPSRIAAPASCRLAPGAAAKKRFDGVFIDPPYGKGFAVQALQAIAGLSLIKPGGWVTVEVGRREQTPEAAAGPRLLVTRVREDAYGDTKLALYEACEAEVRSEHVGDAVLPTAEVER